MHAAITNRVDWATFHAAAGWLIENETVRIAERLGHDQHA